MGAFKGGNEVGVGFRGEIGKGEEEVCHSFLVSSTHSEEGMGDKRQN